ncbi:Secretory carrier-associated membrane protein 2 [Dermatophagoides farinae]|uniref:Secretory carrier-associated membrane protein n=1 Tax=Dermatophagoides farinae TaxID=6954 RepID=A0A922KZB3_DERFA|nr:Secretory carrier-associated membrane protein 2 [Dermatophagoides farinae]
MSTYNFENDPFADPAITAAANSGQRNSNNNAISAASDAFDYNPFANQPTVTTTATTTTATNVDPFSPTLETAPASTAITSPTTAILSPTNVNLSYNNPPQQQPTNSSSSSSNNITAEQLRQRQEELDRKAAELAAREAELHRAQRLNTRENNFPPLPSFFPCQPCFYQDINVEIEINFQNIVRQVYQLWMFYIIALLVNFIGCLFAFIEGIPESAGMFSFSLVTIVLFTPLSFICWFRPLYKAFRDDSSFNFMIFFFVFFCQLVLSSVWALGLPGSGGIGLIQTLKYFSTSGISGWFRIICLLCTFVLSCYALASVYILIKVHGIYHKSDLSIQKAQAEFTSRVMSNERVQQMATNAAQQAARQAMNQAFNPQQQQQQSEGGGFRY